MNPIFLIRHIHNLFVYGLSLDVKNMSNIERTNADHKIILRKCEKFQAH